MKKTPKIKVFETFAGIGSQHKALQILKENKYLDYEISATSEWDMWANISYNAIHHHNKNIASNLSDQEINDFLLKFHHSNDSKELAKPEFVLKQTRQVREMLYSSIINANNLGSILNITGKQLVEQTKGGVDLITYSFPCQDLSMAGKNKGMKKGDETRSGLLWQIERIINELDKLNKLPRYLLLENVMNMIQSQHKEQYLEWMNFLNQKGYETKTYNLNAADFGIPQKRKRIFALSVFKGESQKTKIDSEVIVFNDIKDISKNLAIDKKIEDLLKVDYQNKTQYQEAKDSIPNRTPSREKMYFKNDLLHSFEKEQSERFKNFQKYKSNQYITEKNIRTITTKQDRHPNSGVINLKGSKLAREEENLFYQNDKKQKANYRFLTPRETFLFMGFSDEDFDQVLKAKKIINKNTQHKKLNNIVLYRQSGNSIAVNILVAIFNEITKKENRHD
ncbi:DNA (cytosine-5-)-methyltransferase [Williamsoniiplasma luminosum]|uniref:Cytosine-specific methyltransferase n=1 Tax=Williamsoniiplasma luminosum TaxID=214888 RepID=A0A2S0NJA2_9MOLU|nr:DNA (cytosine-5-)-methyltransferase [Williamsoniiplasma luminosum]AVP49100.1 MAG: hypothetical protein C5T88_00675 [Williamsoniiplasma luminosum]